MLDPQKEHYLFDIPQWVPTKIIDGQQLKLIEWQGYESIRSNADRLSLSYSPESITIPFVNMVHPVGNSHGIGLSFSLHNPTLTPIEFENKIQYWVKRADANPEKYTWIMIGNNTAVVHHGDPKDFESSSIHIISERFEGGISSSRYTWDVLLEMLTSIPKFSDVETETTTNPYEGRMIVDSYELEGFSNFLNDPSVTLNIPKEVKIGDTFDIIYSWSIPQFSQYVEIDTTQRDKLRGYPHLIYLPLGMEILDSSYEIIDNKAQRFLSFDEADTKHTIHLRFNEKLKPNEKLTIVIGNNNLNFALYKQEDK